MRLYLVASTQHAARLFAEPERAWLRTAIAAQIAHSNGGAVLVVVSPAGAPEVLPVTNGVEIADALEGVPGAVAFALRNLPVDARADMADSGPPSRDPALAAVEMEVERLRKVESAARELLAALPRCRWCSSRPTMGGAPAGAPNCTRCGAYTVGLASPHAEQVRALEALLAPAVEEPRP